MTAPRHFLELSDIGGGGLRAILDIAAAHKGVRTGRALAGGALGMIFEKPSTRTRLSFEVAATRLGGHAITMKPGELQLGRGETVADTAAVLARYVDAVMLRSLDHDRLLTLAEHSTVPVINGLTPKSHPCQLMADIMTFEAHRGAIAGARVAWCGDGNNNVAASWIQAAACFGFHLTIAAPAAHAPRPDLLAWARGQGAAITVTEDAAAAVRGADAVVTDTWLSMDTPKDEYDRRLAELAPFRVTEALMAEAGPEAVFLHCLPAHRGEEVTAEVIDGPQSLVLDEAENRLHAQLGILLWCLGLDAAG